MLIACTVWWRIYIDGEKNKFGVCVCEAKKSEKRVYGIYVRKKCSFETSQCH